MVYKACRGDSTASRVTHHSAHGVDRNVYVTAREIFVGEGQEGR